MNSVFSLHILENALEMRVVGRNGKEGDGNEPPAYPLDEMVERQFPWSLHTSREFSHFSGMILETGSTLDSIKINRHMITDSLETMTQLMMQDQLVFGT